MHCFTNTVAEHMPAPYDLTYQKGVVSVLHCEDSNLEHCDDVSTIY